MKERSSAPPKQQRRLQLGSQAGQSSPPSPPSSAPTPAPDAAAGAADIEGGGGVPSSMWLDGAGGC
eukprot:gene2081-1233_t